MKPATILLVEDNPITRKMVRLALVPEGFTVIEAPDARSAISLMVERPPDLVLQDLLLPDMDGLELVKLLRGLPGGDTVPIVAFSAFVYKLEEARGGPWFTDCLAKPIEPSRLLERVRAYTQPQVLR